MTSRFETLSPEAMTPEQRKVYDAIVGGPRGGIRGPFNVLLRSPELADRAQKLGEFIRFQSSLPRHLNELAILVTARYWKAQYEWYAHAELALKAGLDPAIIEAIGRNQRPAKMKPEEAVVYEFCHQLHHRKEVDDAAFKAAVAQFGERGAADLIGACGYYTLVAMVLNVDRHPLPEGATPLA